MTFTFNPMELFEDGSNNIKYIHNPMNLFEEDNSDAKEDNLIEKALERIKKDVKDNDLTAIEELLEHVSINNIKGYLAEN